MPQNKRALKNPSLSVDTYYMPPLQSSFLLPVPAAMRWLMGLTAMNVVGTSTRSGPEGTMGSDVAPSGEGAHVDRYF